MKLVKLKQPNQTKPVQGIILDPSLQTDNTDLMVMVMQLHVKNKQPLIGI